MSVEICYDIQYDVFNVQINSNGMENCLNS